jgi:hypothetical protein
MENCKSTSTLMNQKKKFNKDDEADKVDEGQYTSLIGCSMYLTTIRPNITFVISLLSWFMHCTAGELHFQAAKRIVRYIKGTMNYDIKFSHLQSCMLHSYSDND